MAKSYITEFVESVENSRQTLINNLKNKNQPANLSMTLDNLVSMVNDINLQQVIPAYVRDSNLPDIDTEFDNDPLRKINGGQYTGCVYNIFTFTNGKNTIDITGASSSKPIEKIVFSDGTVIENITAASYTHTMESSGIYTLEDGTKVGISKHYLTEYNASDKSIGVISTTYLLETIDDVQTSILPSKGYNYTRVVGSNTTALTYNSYAGAYDTKHLRIDCDFNFTEMQGSTYSELPSIEFYGKYVGTGSSFTIGNNTVGCFMNYVKFPEFENDVNITLACQTHGLYIPDKAKSISYKSNINFQIYSIHIGNGLESTINTQFLKNTLRDVTTSQNIFSKNTSAITLDFSSCFRLTKQSALNILNGLADRTDMTANILKLSSATKLLLTDEEKAIATNKNWTLS